MAKLGRYSADRKKSETITADRTVSVADCGTIFSVDASSNTVALTLPSVANAGKGWWIKVFVVDSSQNVTIVTSGSENVMLGYALNQAADNAAVTFTNDKDGDRITLGSGATSAVAEVICDGTFMLVEAIGDHATADNKIVLDKAT